MSHENPHNTDKRNPLELKTGRSSIDEFLKKPDKEKTESLKQRYQRKKNLKSRIFPTTSDLKYDHEKISKYIEYEQSQGGRNTIKQKIQDAFYRRFYTKVRGRMRPFYYSRQFQETAFMHFPRLCFLLFTCYIIHKMQLSQEKEQKNKRFARSYRQEDVDKQLTQINKIIGANENTFEPGKNVEFNREYDPMFRNKDNKNEEDFSEVLQQLDDKKF
ncbi:unnamed protein product [Moneuplotes crassus]|uniref:Uncharacterized protein n=1 Tax=Euplotes crassus TaxID=5936 RepID=A0AAD1XW50_EUPCR|nr:unnamed protein product [Moneuplotes crassus]